MYLFFLAVLTRILIYIAQALSNMFARMYGTQVLGS